MPKVEGWSLGRNGNVDVFCFREREEQDLSATVGSGEAEGDPAGTGKRLRQLSRHTSGWTGRDTFVSSIGRSRPISGRISSVSTSLPFLATENCGAADLDVSHDGQLRDGKRTTFNRFDPDRESVDEDLDLRDEIQCIALEFPCYGRPRITDELKRRGRETRHRRVGRIMREDNLLCLRKRKFVVTTDSNHNLRVYPNLAGSMTPWVTAHRSSSNLRCLLLPFTLFTTGDRRKKRGR